LIIASTARNLSQPEIEIAKLLLARGAEVNAKGDNNSNPLHFAMSYNHLKIAELLIKNGADINATESLDNRTTLHNAAEGLFTYDEKHGPEIVDIPSIVQYRSNWERTLMQWMKMDIQHYIWLQSI